MHTHRPTWIALAALLAVILAGAAQTGSRQALNPPGTEASPNFSNGILAGRTLYVAGQQGTDQKGHLLNGIAAQTKGALQNIRRVVQAAGMRMSDVVAVNVYLADIHDFAAMNQIYVTMFPNPRPSRTTVQVSGLANNARIEISAIAVKP